MAQMDANEGKDGDARESREKTRKGRGFLTADYGVEMNTYMSAPGSDPTTERFNSLIVKSIHRRTVVGSPHPDCILTNHCERTNLSFRLFTRRLTRQTICYSKKIINHKRAIALTIAHFNFCRKRPARGMTPAMAAGFTDHVWTVEEWLTAQV
jgi:hypothetical protein